jgi:hypothetical protein
MLISGIFLPVFESGLYIFANMSVQIPDDLKSPHLQHIYWYDVNFSNLYTKIGWKRENPNLLRCRSELTTYMYHVLLDKQFIGL